MKITNDGRYTVTMNEHLDAVKDMMHKMVDGFFNGEFNNPGGCLANLMEHIGQMHLLYEAANVDNTDEIIYSVGDMIQSFIEGREEEIQATTDGTITRD